MYLDIVIIDYLHVNGVLQTFRIVPRHSPDSERVVVDRLSDIDRSFDTQHRDVDIGPFRVYNIADCRISESRAKLKTFSKYNDLIKFNYEHMYIPVGMSNQAHHGYYCLMLPGGYQINELFIVDPFDKPGSTPNKRKQFRRHTVCDSKKNAVSVVLELRSNRGSFSFQLYCNLRHIGHLSKEAIYKDKYTEEYWSDDALEYLSHLTYEKADSLRDHIFTQIGEGADYLELKPNFFGIGFNLNKIIKKVFGKTKE